MKKKKIIACIILILGLIIISLGIFLLFKNSTDKPNNNSNNQTKEINLQIQNFMVDKSINDEIKLSLDILNTSEKKIPSQKIYLNFYDENKILYKYDYELKEMNEHEKITINAVINFKYDKITKYEFEFDNLKKVLEPIYIS